MSTLPDGFLVSLAVRFDRPHLAGITCSGSYARGDAGPHSDVDLQLYVQNGSGAVPEPYMLRYVDDRLVSLKRLTAQDQRAQLQRPEDAIWAVPGLRQARILIDKDGSPTVLKQAALDFDWAPLQALADAYAAHELMACAEEAHKILNGLHWKDESAILYGVWGMLKGLASAVATQRGVLIDTANRYFDLIQGSVGVQSEWSHCFRLALGAEANSAGGSPVRGRGEASLRLYRETARFPADLIPPEHRELAERTLERIGAARY